MQQLPKQVDLFLKEISEMMKEKVIDLLVTKDSGVKGLSELNLEKVPDEFIQPPEERLENINVAFDKSIPIIDITTIGNDPGIAESICKAAAKYGFFQIINHGIPVEVVEDVKKAAHDFFEQPVEERRKFLKENSPTPSAVLNPYPDKFVEWKDHLVHYVNKLFEDEDSKLWPPVSRDRVLRYVKFARPIMRKLLEVLLDGINVKKIDEVKECALMGLLTVSLIQYPECPNPDMVAGSTCHSDMSSITLLLQDDVGGLYARDMSSEDNWIHVEPVKGSLIVNIGDTMQIMSNDRYKSIEHRVFLTGRKSRVSVPIFTNALSDASIAPLPEVLEADEKPIYKQFLFQDYFNHFYSKAQDGKQAAINFAKI